MKASLQPYRSLVIDLMGRSQSDHHNRLHESSIMQWFTGAGGQFEACSGKHGETCSLCMFLQISVSATTGRHRDIVSLLICLLSMPFGYRQWCGS